MPAISYSLSPAIMDSLQKIEFLRREILLTPLSPKTELRLRWEAMLDRIYWSFSLLDSRVPKREEFVRVLTYHRSRKPTHFGKDVASYKRALDYISQEWLVSEKRITLSTILKLYEFGCSGQFLPLKERDVKEVFDYLQVSSEKPIIQAGIVQIQLLKIAPFTKDNEQISWLTGQLFLYKYGYDFRGLLVLEEYWRRNLMSFKKIVQESLQNRNLTFWLEFFLLGMVIQLEKVVQNISVPNYKIEIPSSFWELNDRQMSILTLLEEPQATVTNRKVQDLFQVSQVTASRDLAKLVTLGLLFHHGRGRSVYYTKV